MFGYKPSRRARLVLNNPVKFGLRVLRQFRANGGILLAAAVAYHTLLSIIPILALTAIGLSRWFDPLVVEDAVRGLLELVAPTQIDPVLQQLSEFASRTGVIGLVGFGSLVFFSAMAFSTLGNALTVIFKPEDAERRRKPWLSLLLPYVFVMFIGLAMLAVTLITGLLDTLSSTGFAGWLPDAGVLTMVFGFIGEMVLFAAIYFVLPPVTVRLRHALVGAFTAAVLWEIMRRLLVWYFVNLSSVNVIYGTFATVLVIVLSLEVAITILLLGAQVIREYGLLRRRPRIHSQSLLSSQ